MYVGTAAGYMYALAPNGYVRWRVDLGHQFNSCPQIPDGWGITGTPTADPQAGLLTSSMRSAGCMRSTWRPATSGRLAHRPLQRLPHELDWGASTIVAGSL